MCVITWHFLITQVPLKVQIIDYLLTSINTQVDWCQSNIDGAEGTLIYYDEKDKILRWRNYKNRGNHLPAFMNTSEGEDLGWESMATEHNWERKSNV